MSLKSAAILALAVVVADRVTKLMVMASLDLGESVPVVPGFFSLTHVLNPGAAFGIFADSAARTWLLGAVAVAAVAGLTWLLVQLPSGRVAERAAAAAVIGGAIGNLYDRIERGAVVDFLDFYVGRWHWPAFNVADSCITVGVAVLVLGSFLADRDDEADRGATNG